MRIIRYYTGISNIKFAPADDFGFGGGSSSAEDVNTHQETNANTQEEHNDVNNTNENNNNANENDNNENNNEEIAIEVGSEVTIGEDVYTVDENKNLVDKDGNIFKKADEVQDYLKGFDTVEDEPETINLAAIQQALGVDITDDNDKPVTFEDNIQGIQAYVNAVIESARQDNYETAINTLYQRYPIIEDVLNYYVANGNSLEGFNQQRDYSNIVIEDDNEAQQEAIIREAFALRGQKGVDNWIAYQKSQGTLAATAKEELAAMQETVQQQKEALAQQAEEAEAQRQAELQAYWSGVNKVIESRQIAGYQIPEHFTRVQNGQKVSATPKDFFKYLYLVDEDGHSQYEYDLAKQTMESRRDDEILRAYLLYTGGSYANLVNMAINKEKVNNLHLKARERNVSKVSIRKPAPTKNNLSNENFGY